MARLDWEDVPNFWKSGKGLFEPILFICSIILGLLFAFATYEFWLDRIIFLFGSLLLGLVGGESLFYWWLLKPLNIKQKAHWKEGNPVVGFFEYPPNPIWLDKLIIPLWISKLADKTEHTTRCGVYLGSSIAVIINLILEF